MSAPRGRWAGFALGLALCAGCDDGVDDAADPGALDGAVAPVDRGATPDGDLRDAGALDGGALDAAWAEDGGRGEDAAPDAAPPDPEACNGARHLCDRPLPEVAVAMTHNAHAVEPPFSPFAANQHLPIEAQLALGVRGLGIKLYWSDDPDCGPLDLYGWHGFARLGCVPFAEVGADLAAFLGSHPRDLLVVTVEGDAPADRVRDGLVAAGLDTWLAAPPADGVWPTLGALIEADTRLVVLRSGGGAGFANLWTEARDTPYDFFYTDDFACGPNRGPADAPFFLLNHFLTRLRPVPDEAPVTNSLAVLGDRALACSADRGQLPSFVYVDFVADGDVLAVVDALNSPGTPEDRRAALQALVDDAPQP